MRIVDAFITELDEPALERLAMRLTPYLPRVEQATDPDPWLNAAEAADYVGLTKNALHKHTAARTIPFEQDGPGAKLWFKRSELDAWRRGTRAPKEPEADYPAGSGPYGF